MPLQAVIDLNKILFIPFNAGCQLLNGQIAKNHS
jgi:hypothetical protein